MYGKYPKVQKDGKWVEQNGLDGAPKAWPTTDCSKDPILTVQAQRNDTDINQIMKKIEKGMMLNINQKEGTFQDISEFNGLEDAYIKVQKANEDFMKLPADIRSRFENDPVNLVEFLSDEGNRAEAEELGLIEPKEAGKPASIPPEPANAQSPT